MVAGQTAAEDPTGSDVPVVRVDAPTVGPKWSPDLIRRVFRRADFLRCRAGPQPPPATYRFSIDHDGAVTSAEAIDISGQPATDAAHAYAVEILRGLKFPVGMGPMRRPAHHAARA